MKFRSAALVGILFATTTHATTITEQQPVFHTDNGSAVYNTPPSGGTIQVIHGTSLNKVFHDVPDNDEEEEVTVSEAEVDLSKLFSLESDTIEIDLGSGGIQFVRDRNLDQTHNDHHHTNRRRRKLRRVQEMKEDSVEDVVECFIDGTCTNEHYDYLPPNSVFGETDPTQKFQYFEGKATYQEAEATVYVKSLIHPGGNNKYLSGIIITSRYEYIFRGDPSTGKTFLTQLDPEMFPSMPPPFDPMEEEDFDDPVDVGGGRMRTKRELFMEEKSMFDGLLEAEKKRKKRLGNKDSSSGGGRGLQTDDGTVLDVLVAYTKSAMCQSNSQSYPCDDIAPSQHLAMINKAEEAVAQTNQAYINSGINTQLRLVYVHYADYDDRSDSCGSVLRAVTYTDGLMDEVHELRDTWGADFVALLTSTAAGTCGGVAWLGPYSTHMFSVTKWPYAAGGTFAHELGHNYGCEHDRLNANPGKPYQYGWQDPEGEFRTIMAYNCPNRYCPRKNYFSNPFTRYNGKIMGNESNDCARRHNEVKETIALYRKARITNAPTISLAPSMSSVPSQSPTIAPTGKPSLSLVPSSTPSLSSMPSSLPSEYPTFDIGSLEDFKRVQSPGTTAFQVQHGIMFDIQAKDYEVTIHNFRIPFLRAAESITVSIWVHDGPFWYEKNNPSEWNLVGSPEAYSPGNTLEDPVPLPLRGGTEYGFEPIVIAPGEKKGIYILVNETSLEDNLIGMDTRSATSCSIDALAPYSFPTWFESESLIVSQGVYKEDWMTSVGSALDSYNFIGTIYYESDAPTTQTPSLSPSLSLVPSASSSSSLQPSETPAFLEISSPSAIQVSAVDGIMFNIEAIDRDIFISSFKLIIYSVSTEAVDNVVDLALFSSSDSFFNETLGDVFDKDTWSYHGTAQVTASSTLVPSAIPENSFQPIFVKQGSTVGFYLTIIDSLRNHKILARLGGTFLANDFQNTNVKMKYGAALQWETCDGWGVVLKDTSSTPTSHGFLGSVLYQDLTGSEQVPSTAPSELPSASLAPSLSLAPSVAPSQSSSPSIASSLSPSVSLVPSSSPSKTFKPTYDSRTLQTENDEENDGSPGNGVMFDIIAKRPVQIRGFTLSGLQTYPMDIIIYSSQGSHYYKYDDENEWDVVATFSNWTGGESKISFPPVSMPVNVSVAFYIAIIDTYGEEYPLLNSFLPGSNYRNGVWASDDYIDLMEGVKMYGINRDWPFGMGTAESGVYMLEGPGGTSFNMKNSIIEYRVIDTIMPSTAPSTSQEPTLSAAPSESPSESFQPSQSPTISLAPSSEPSDSPSLSINPSAIPSASPSSTPSISAVPSGGPSISSQPSESPSSKPSSQPSSQPSSNPSVSLQPSDIPSTSPSESPTISMMPSNSPSVSLMPSMDRLSLASASESSSVGAGYGVMFEVKALRAISVETFAVKHFSSSGSWNFRVYYKSGSLDSSSWNNANAWTLMGETSYSSTPSNPVRLPSQNMEAVFINAQQTYSFYIACEDNYFRVHGASAGETVSNSDVVLSAGLRKYPYGDLFSSSNQQTYLFQGDLVYSYAIEPPSVSPSALPSVSPSVSIAPTSQSGVPSIMPSSSSQPSQQPTGDPTREITPAPTPDPFKQARIEIVIPSTISLSGFQIPSSTVEMQTVVTILANNIAAAMSSNLNTSQRVKSVNIISINGVPVSGGFSLRRLIGRNLSAATIEYEVLLEEICSNDGCSDADTAAQALYAQATDAMREEINSGAFATAVQSDATSANVNALLAIAVESSDFSAVILNLVGALSIFYPDWVNSGYCSNDGNNPIYMDNSELWLSSSKQECCETFFNYAYNACMGISAAAIGWYPAWAHSNNEAKCVNDNAIPDYMRADSKSWVYPDATSCCRRYYDYQVEECLSNTGVTTVEEYKFYPAWAIQDSSPKCINGTDAPHYMKRSPEIWLSDDAAECCKTHYFYDENVCISASGGSVAQIATDKYYANYATEVCVKDCLVDESDPECGGLAKPWYELFDNAKKCCASKLNWVKLRDCTP